MAEGILLNIAQGIIERLDSPAFQDIGSTCGIQDELQKLKETVARFKDLLLGVEQKQVNNEVKWWLQSIEDAIYEADDVLDEFYAEAQRRQLVRGNTELSKKVHLCFSTSNQLVFRLKIGQKINGINKRLSRVASVPKENIIIGRDEDKKAIIQLLLDPTSTEKVSTISIVGRGGMGKTALCQLIFDDKEIQKNFELKIWSCVSNIFDLDIVVKKILQSEHNEIQQLQNDLRRKVDGKKYLLVLDDVGNEDPEKWRSLKDLLMGGQKGSRILITTRSEIVATISNTAKSYSLRELDEDQSWSLFKKMAFKDGKEPKNSRIKEVGMEVAKICQGVPLVIRTIGETLCTKHHETEWLKFREKKLSKINQEEIDVLPTIKLSYDVLPSHLKHCFAYCSLFSPDYEISVQRLIKLWVAQGFIKSIDENKALEDVAYDYYMQLLSKSFFQREKTDEFGMIKRCEMHILTNEFAILVGVGSAVVDLNQKKFHKKLRHVSFNFQVDSKWEGPTSLLKANKIRTFLFPCHKYSTNRDGSLRNSLCATIVSNFKLLRTLSLNRLGITTLPNCIKKMKHLRYLDLSCNPIERLPDWIVGLSNLVTLDLTYCGDLVELPGEIKEMIELRHLILEGCYKLTRMPRGLGDLNDLRTLDRFVLSENNSMSRDSAGLRTLGKLKELRGELEITNLSHVMSELNVGTPLEDKQHLHSLTLKWKEGEDGKPVYEKDIVQSIRVLRPHPNLKELTVGYYGGVRFASWFSSLKSIVNLKLFLCEKCKDLPPLDHLPSLKYLELSLLEKLEYIADNYTFNTVNRMPFFRSLEELRIQCCPVLKGWWRTLTHNTASSSSSSTENRSLPSFPCLSKLTIICCPNLKSMPLYPNVDRIHLSGTSSKVHPSWFVRGASDITHDGGVDVSSSPHLSKLTYLSLHGIEDLEWLTSEGMANLTSLQELTITDCSDLASLPERIASLTSFQSLTIEDCPNLAALPKGIANLASLQSLSIGNCPKLASLPYQEMGNLTSFRELTFRDCSNLASMIKGIANLRSLQSLMIEHCTDLASLPEEISKLTSLQKLTIRVCPNLASIPEGTRQLPCFNTSEIRDCPKLPQKMQERNR